MLILTLFILSSLCTVDLIETRPYSHKILFVALASLLLILTSAPLLLILALACFANFVTVFTNCLFLPLAHVLLDLALVLLIVEFVQLNVATVLLILTSF